MDEAATQQDAEQIYFAARRQFADDLSALHVRAASPTYKKLEKGSGGRFTDSSVSDWFNAKYFPSQENTLVLVSMLATPDDSVPDLKKEWKLRWQNVRNLQRTTKPPALPTHVAQAAVDDPADTPKQPSSARTIAAKFLKVLLGSRHPARPKAAPAPRIRMVGIALAATTLACVATGIVTDKVVNNRIASASRSANDPPPPTALQTMPSGFGTVSAVAASTQHVLAAGGGDSGGQVMLWSITNPRAPKALLPKPPDCGVGPVTTLTFSPDGTTMAVGGDDGKVALWNVTNPDEPTALTTPVAADVGPIASVAFSPDGRTLAIGGSHGLQLWSTSDLSHISNSPTSTVPAASGAVRSVAFSPDGRILAAGTDSGSIILWNANGPTTAKPLPTPEISPSNDADAPATLDHVDTVAFSNDSTTLFVGDADGDVTTLYISQTPATEASEPWNAIGSSSTPPIFSIAASSDGDALAIADGNTIAVYVQPGELNSSDLDPFDAYLTGDSGPVESLAFVPDTDTLISGSADGLVRIWNVPYVPPSDSGTY